MHEERDERLIRRLESFSDLVMGFSIALLGLTLVIPAHTIDFFRNPWTLIGYFWTFAVIARLWFGHQKLFARHFSPSGPSIIVNFLFLSMLGLIVFFVQTFARVSSESDHTLAFLAYWGATAIAIGALGVLYELGTRARASVLTAEEQRHGHRRAIIDVTQGVALLVVVAVELHFFGSITLAATAYLGVAAIGARQVARAMNAWLVPG